jgi:TolB protein
MDGKSDNSSSGTGRGGALNRRWLALGGLAAALLVVMLCLVAVAGIGGLLWLRPAQTTAVPAAPPVGEAQQAPVAAPTTAEPPGAAPPAMDINRIAYIDLAGRVGTVAPDGSAGRLLTSTGASYQFPAWSPDSRRIAAVGNDGSQGGVYAWADQENAPRSDLYTSRRRPPLYLYWSPDSRQVSFLANERSGLGLWLAPADGAAPARQIASGQPFYWQWSQGGDQLLVHSGGLGPGAQLAWLETTAGETGANVASPGLFQAPGISADGRYLAYGQRDGERFLVAVEERASGQRATTPHSGVAALSWSPAEPYLAWTSPRNNQFSAAGPLRLLDAASGEIFVLVQDTVLAFFWSPDGQSIAYLTLASGGGDAGASRPAGLAASARSPARQYNALSLRLWVVDVASGQQRQLYTFRPSEIFITQFLPFFDQYALSHRLWSPASDALVLPMLDGNGNSAIHVVAVESGESTHVADGSMAFWSWR